MIPPMPIEPQTRALIRMAVREDLGRDANGKIIGDLTARLAIPADARGAARIVARKPGVVCGAFLLAAILKEYPGGADATLEVATFDGGRVEPDQVIARISGNMGTLLSAERVLLNFLGALSGIATLTRSYVNAIKDIRGPNGAAPVVCDTRKTRPAYRRLEKYAVRCGGAVSHRMGLYDGAMIKDNHIAALRGQLGAGQTLAQLTAHVRARMPSGVTLWLEVDTLDQLAAALPGGGADIILLDNMPPDTLRAAVTLRDKLANSRTPLLEASGGVTLSNVAAVAATGVDRISIGALTHSAPALDVSMEMEG